MQTVRRNGHVGKLGCCCAVPGRTFPCGCCCLLVRPAARSDERDACVSVRMQVALVDLHQHMVDAAAAELGELYPGTRSAAIECDVGDASSMGACLDTVLTSFPGVPIGAVFANAGVIFNKTILRSRIEDFELTLRVNVIGVVNTIQAFVPVLQQQDTPSVMCSTASVGGISRGDGGGAAYQGSKAAIVSISETLSFELARRYPQVRVHVLW